MMHWQDAMCCGPLARLPLSLNLIWQLLGPRYQITIVSAAACKDVNRPLRLLPERGSANCLFSDNGHSVQSVLKIWQFFCSLLVKHSKVHKTSIFQSPKEMLQINHVLLPCCQTDACVINKHFGDFFALHNSGVLDPAD